MKYTEEKIREAVANSFNYTQVCKYLGCKSLGGAWNNIRARILRFNIDTSHFNNEHCVRGGRKAARQKKRTVESVLYHDNTLTDRVNHSLLKRCLFDIGRLYVCAICGNTGEWLGEKLDLQIDHIDGNWQNNERDNLRFICPNCHSQTKTFGTKKRELS